MYFSLKWKQIWRVSPSTFSNNSQSGASPPTSKSRITISPSILSDSSAQQAAQLRAWSLRGRTRSTPCSASYSTQAPPTPGILHSWWHAPCRISRAASPGWCRVQVRSVLRRRRWGCIQQVRVAFPATSHICILVRHQWQRPVREVRRSEAAPLPWRLQKGRKRSHSHGWTVTLRSLRFLWWRQIASARWGSLPMEGAYQAGRWQLLSLQQFIRALSLWGWQHVQDFCSPRPRAPWECQVSLVA